jgi:D-aminopeptidase
MARAADLPRRIGLLPSGPTGSVHDVPGVGFGHCALLIDESEPPTGRGVVRTGVSVLHLTGDGFGSPVPAGAAVLNGMGECTGLVTVSEWGRAETPEPGAGSGPVQWVQTPCTSLARCERPGLLR